MSYPLRDTYHRLRKSLTLGAGRLWPAKAFGQCVDTLVENRLPPCRTSFSGPMPEQARAFLDGWSKVPDLETLYRVKEPCTIDPKMGIIFDRGRVVWGSSDLPQSEKNPSFAAHLGKPARAFDEAVSLHHFHGDNYFHFFLYVLAKLHAADSHGIAPSAPVIVSEKTGATRFFREAEELGLFGDREIIRQGRREILKVDRLYLVRSFFCRKAFFDWVCQHLDLPDNVETGRRLLILRGEDAANGRSLRNREEVIRLAEQHGFETVDPGSLSLRNQAQLFNEARAVVGQHGAGLTNILFRRSGPCDLVELFSPGMGSPHYYMMAQEKGFGYRSIMTRNPQGRAFTASTEVDLPELEAALKAHYK
ncbi:DUF563 domain-containing protein [Roseibium sp. RKSG952]|uniref:glycosyltransferase family 61 protein n=1 Tax=Roseibium sp. RKSG952 TaxID=2529384 RepID=UPI0012BCA561|nr:glycosyltransferase family 61 protein [Roseibium sp. RKSG952]MTH97010.1 glycosyltransferase family 61 protein [Roseibium sp. RKSG952]